MNQLAPPALRQSVKRGYQMRSSSCSRKQITLEMNDDPNEPGIHPLEASARRIAISLIERGLEYYECETPSDAEDTYKVNCSPSTRSKTRPNASVQRTALKTSPCGSIEFVRHGNCLRCSGDVLGVCWHCRECFPAYGGPCASRGRHPEDE